MNKYIIGIDGMKCGMCEVHVEETIAKDVKAKKIKANRHNKEVVVITDLELNEFYFHKILDPTGYRITSFKKEEATKKLFGWK